MADIKDYLLDIVKNTSCLGSDVVLKIVGSEESTFIRGRRDDCSIVMEAKLNNVVSDFNGVMGIDDPKMLSGLLNSPIFKNKESKIKIKRERKSSIEIPTEIVLEAVGSVASYRLCGESIIPKQYAPEKYDWSIIVEQPSKNKLTEFSNLASIYSGLEDKFSVKTVGGELKFFIGDENSSSHRANFTFADNIDGSVRTGLCWMVKDVLDVLKLGDGAKTTLKIANLGVMEIHIDTGLCHYNFVLQAKES